MARPRAPFEAVILGAALAIALRYGQNELPKQLIAAGGLAPNWYSLAAPPLYALVELAPGLVSGWLASRQELLCGFLSGLLGAVLYWALFGTFGRSIAAGGMSEVLFFAVRLLSIAVSAGFFGLAGAATAKLLRSNHRRRAP